MGRDIGYQEPQKCLSVSSESFYEKSPSAFTTVGLGCTHQLRKFSLNYYNLIIWREVEKDGLLHSVNKDKAIQILFHTLFIHIDCIHQASFSEGFWFAF